MSISAGPVSMFVSALDKWLAAVERRDHADAGFYANEVKVAGKALAIDPEFKRCFASHCDRADDPDPESAVEHIGALVRALSEAGRARPPSSTN